MMYANGDIQAVFIDRDGTIGGTGHFIHPRDFQLYPNAQEAIQLLKGTGTKVFAFTNQHRISRGQATVQEFEQQFQEFGFDQAYICSHEEECSCRKPKPGMLLQAAAQHGLDLTKCIVIGDVGDTDMLAAHAVGATKIMVRTGWGESSLTKFRDKWAETEPEYIAADILEAVHWIVGNKG
ncbi:HAD-IIIA family hydrolase [Paenibacillus silvae]|uniref:HAD-IIIA family hydrolase n=1 Tax=Paenibacillus TaxID=44249 RepID=UPI001C115881|nr:MULTISPECIES: HAD-IIIA family hydrolase [Paenibacillus]MBU5353925.1 HAD-IIIA family hydrolase [Paenibacillus barcinonensis]MDM5279095.1 HAD-IIIA family hydrolase [Paenibacillus silvae]